MLSLHDAQQILGLYGVTVNTCLKSGAVITLLNHSSETKISSSLFDKLTDAASKVNVSSDLKLPDVSFGVEFEFVGDSSQLDKFNACMLKMFNDSYMYSGSYVHNKGDIWLLGRDGSIDTSPSKIDSAYSYELSTPKLNLHNVSDCETLREVIDLVKNVLHGEVNSSCGTHVHIGLPAEGLTKKKLRQLLCVYSMLESRVFDPLVPKSRRKNKYCKKTEAYLDLKYQKLSTRYCEFDAECKCIKLHLECRQLEGTLDTQLIFYWAHLQAMIIYDILTAIRTSNRSYLDCICQLNAFDMLFKYHLGSTAVNQFIDRIIRFKSRSIQSDYQRR